MSLDGQPDDWPFENLKLGEYFALARDAALIVREHRIGFAEAVEAVLSGRNVTDRERRMLCEKTRSIIYLGREDA